MNLNNTHLIFCSAAFHIPHYSNELRETEYLFCLKQLFRFKPSNIDVVVCDNTIQSLEDIKNNELKYLLTHSTKFFILNRNIGKQNIGMGELDELIHVYNNVNFKNYDKIIYFTLRKIMTSPWLFEKVNTMKKNALISNPKYLCINNNINFYYSDSTGLLYNDMFFSLSSDLMINYIQYSRDRILYNLQNGVGSEQNLYKFINENNIDYEFLDCLGLIRIDYKANNQIQLV
jgi:hypothetical protein